MSSEADQAFIKIANEIGALSHGHTGEGLEKLRSLIKILKKQKKSFLYNKLFQATKSWDKNKEEGVWASSEQADFNKYKFLQGDIIKSKHVIGPSGERIHECYWLVLSVDCDCARSNQEYFSLARIEEFDANIVSLSLSFKSPKWFPIPPVVEGEEWMAADLNTPFFLTPAYLYFCDVIKSMTVEGWHILNAILQEKYTRSLNVEESILLRNISV